MNRFFSKTMFLLLVGLLLGSVPHTFALQNFSETVRGAPKKLGEAVSDSLSGSGNGMYLKVYEDVIRNPNKLLKERVSQRFGINFDLDLAPRPDTVGPAWFKDFFHVGPQDLFAKVPLVQPNLKDNLQRVCVEMRLAQIDDRRMEWEILKKRAKEKKEKLLTPKPSKKGEKPPAPNLAEIEFLNRIAERLAVNQERDIKALLRNLPSPSQVLDQEALLQCYSEFSQEIDFEMALQTMLNPSRKQLETLQIFTNGVLDNLGGTFSKSFPNYDLLLDLQIIDRMIFGSSVTLDKRKGGVDQIAQMKKEKKGAGSLATAPQIKDILRIQGGFQVNIPGPQSSVFKSPYRLPKFVPAGDNPLIAPDKESFPSTPSTTVYPESKGFGTTADGGKYCPAEMKGGLQLNESEIGAAPGSFTAGGAAGSSVAGSSRGTSTGGSFEEGEDAELVREDGQSPVVVGPGAASSSPFKDKADNTTAKSPSKNRKELCENGFRFGNDFLTLLFCLDIRFSFTGKSWTAAEKIEDQECLFCHIAQINKTFEEKVLKRSVRPHKNTGTIMESAICEGGYSKDIGFHFDIDFVPVKIFPDICYPVGGVSKPEYALLRGHPDISAKVDQPGKSFQCNQDIFAKESVKECEERIGVNRISYDDIKKNYSAAIAKQIQDLDEIGPKENKWVRLVGHQGLAKGILEHFLYRLGKIKKEKAPFGLETVQDFFERQQKLQKKVDEIRSGKLSDGEKMKELVCVKGYLSDQFQCPDGDTLKKLDEDIEKERQRVFTILRRWNQQSKDFNRESRCSQFEGQGLITALEKTFSDRLSLDFYLNTPKQRIKSPQDQFLPQIAATTEIDDVGGLLSQVDRVIKQLGELKDTKEEEKKEERDQVEALQYLALFTEMQSFQKSFDSIRKQVLRFFNEKTFASTSGQKINVLESFLEKAP